MVGQMHLIHALAAAGSVSVATALTYPLDTIKVLVQVGSSSSKRLTAAPVVDRVIRLSGFSGLYNGLGWSVMERILSVGTRFGIYEILTAFCKDGRDNNYVYVSEAMMAGLVSGAVESDEEIGPLSPAAVSLAAGFSGAIAAAASNGFDASRSRSQCCCQSISPWRGSYLVGDFLGLGSSGPQESTPRIAIYLAKA